MSDEELLLFIWVGLVNAILIIHRKVDLCYVPLSYMGKEATILSRIILFYSCLLIGDQILVLVLVLAHVLKAALHKIIQTNNSSHQKVKQLLYLS